MILELCILSANPQEYVCMRQIIVVQQIYESALIYQMSVYER